MYNICYFRFLTRVYSIGLTSSCTTKSFVVAFVLPSMCGNLLEHSLNHHKITLSKTPAHYWVTLAQACSYHCRGQQLAAQITRLHGNDMMLVCFCLNLSDAKHWQTKYWRHIRCRNDIESQKSSRSGATGHSILARLTTITLTGWCTLIGHACISSLRARFSTELRIYDHTVCPLYYVINQADTLRNNDVVIT